MTSDLCLLFQEKYKRDQEKLHEEWLKAQQEIATSKGPQEVAKVFRFVSVLASKDGHLLGGWREFLCWVLVKLFQVFNAFFIPAA